MADTVQNERMEPRLGALKRFIMRSRLASGAIFVGLVAAVLLLVGLRVMNLGFYRVTGQSMEPTTRNGDLLLVTTVPFAPSHGDIVILGLLGDAGRVDDIIKRVIGLPGDTIELRDGAVYVNGEKLAEPYLPGDSFTETGRARTSWRLGPDEYFVLGDNRAHSSDSRYFGPFPASALRARPLYRYWPLDRIGPLR